MSSSYSRPTLLIAKEAVQGHQKEKIANRCSYKRKQEKVKGPKKRSVSGRDVLNMLSSNFYFNIVCVCVMNMFIFPYQNNTQILCGTYLCDYRKKKNVDHN